MASFRAHQMQTKLKSGMVHIHIKMIQCCEAKGVEAGGTYSRDGENVMTLKHNAGLALFLLANGWPENYPQ